MHRAREVRETVAILLAVGPENGDAISYDTGMFGCADTALDTRATVDRSSTRPGLSESADHQTGSGHLPRIRA